MSFGILMASDITDSPPIESCPLVLDAISGRRTLCGSRLRTQGEVLVSS
jgi:hypothetical protein